MAFVGRLPQRRTGKEQEFGDLTMALVGAGGSLLSSVMGGLFGKKSKGPSTEDIAEAQYQATKRLQADQKALDDAEALKTGRLFLEYLGYGNVNTTVPKYLTPIDQTTGQPVIDPKTKKPKKIDRDTLVRAVGYGYYRLAQGDSLGAQQIKNSVYKLGLNPSNLVPIIGQMAMIPPGSTIGSVALPAATGKATPTTLMSGGVPVSEVGGISIAGFEGYLIPIALAGAALFMFSGKGIKGKRRRRRR
jgi:hypothetical protein